MYFVQARCMRFWSLVLCAACASSPSSPPPPVAPPRVSGGPVPQDPLWDTVQARVGTDTMWTEIVAHGPDGERLCGLLVKATLERRPGDKVLGDCHRGGGGRPFSSIHDKPTPEHPDGTILLEDDHPRVVLPEGAEDADVRYTDYSIEPDAETCHAHRTPGLLCLRSAGDMFLVIESDPDGTAPPISH